MKILIVSDAAVPQVNGVVRTNQNTIRVLETLDHTVLHITPNDFPTISLPFYKEISLVWWTKGLRERIDNFNPDAIHISTEGPLGIMARRICIKRGWAFTTAYHTDFPRYLRDHFGIPVMMTSRFIKWFHKQSSTIMVSTPTIAGELSSWGLGNIREWGRGISREFRPLPRKKNSDVAITLLYVGRISREKNIEAFLNIDLPYRKVVVGDGPMLDRYREDHPDVEFTGRMTDTRNLVSRYNQADVLVFPSRTDTYGLVMIEAMACGTPVAAYRVQGPVDVISPDTGVMAERLEDAVLGALQLDRAKVAKEGQRSTWERATQQFVNNLVKKGNDDECS